MRDSPRRKTLSLTLTRACNLRCIYCYEHFKHRRDMPLAVAKAAVFRHFNGDFDEIEIDLAGGEPFLAFDVIRSLCEWTWAHHWPKPYIFFATTNGTLIQGHVQEWIHRNCSRIWLALSVDGTPEMHNTNRSGSFKQLDLQFFKEMWPDQPVKMTVSHETLPQLADGIAFLHDAGFRVQVNLAYGVNWSHEKTIDILADQLYKLVLYYLDNPSRPVCSLLDMEIAQVAVGDRATKRKWCGVGTQITTVDVDGAEYPCHLFQPVSIGSRAVRIGGIDFDNSSLLHDARCDGCILYPICPTCYGINYLETGDPAHRNATLCSVTKLRAAACAYLEAQRLARGSIEARNEQEAASVRLKCEAIRKINSTFSQPSAFAAFQAAEATP